MPSAQPNLKQQVSDHGGWWILSVLAVAVSFWWFGQTINHPGSDYTHEIASAFLGAVLTVSVTASLMRHQTQSAGKLQHELANSETRKEKDVAVYGTKIEVYEQLMDQMEKICIMTKIEPGDLLKLQTLILRIAFVSDEKVLMALSEFVAELRRDIDNPNASEDEAEDERGQGMQITRSERSRIFHRFKDVSLAIREELDIKALCDQTRNSLERIINDLDVAGSKAQKQVTEKSVS